MPSALIFDAVRTPRGKGKKDGSLHQGHASLVVEQPADRVAAAQ
jgi:hypothetical protein